MVWFSGMAAGQDGIGSLLKNHTVAVLLFTAATASVFVTAYYLASLCFRNHQITQREPPSGVATGGSTERVLETGLVNTPTHKYRKNRGDDGSVCAVCLGEFEEGDELRALPGCEHVFHAACIDMWLRSHLTCPICRANTAMPTAETRMDDRVAP